MHKESSIFYSYFFVIGFFVIMLLLFYFLIHFFIPTIQDSRMMYLTLILVALVSGLILLITDIFSKRFQYSFSHYKITRRLVFRFLIISLIPLIIVGALFVINLNNFSQKISSDIEEQIILDSQEILYRESYLLADGIARKINLFKSSFSTMNSLLDFEKLIEQVNDAGFVSNDHYYTSPLTPEWYRLQDKFKDVYNSRSDHIDMIRLFYHNGYIVNGVKWGYEDFSDYKGDKLWFQTVIDEEYPLDTIYMSPISIARQTNSPAIRFACPVDVEKNGNSVREGLFIVNFKSISITEQVQSFSIGKTGHAKLVDVAYENAEGQILSWPVILSRKTSDPIYIINESKEAAPLFSSSVIVGDRGIFNDVDENGNQLIKVYQKVPIEGKSWYLVVILPEDEAYMLSDIIQEQLQKSFNQSMLLLFVVVILTLIFVFIAGLKTSQTITNPIQKIYDATQKIAKGDFTVRTDIHTGDELEDLGRNFNAMSAALEGVHNERKEIDKTKTRFLSITSHEFRSPMTPMKGQLQMLLSGSFGKLSAKQKDATNIVFRNINRLDQIIVDFLEISRIEAARLKFFFIKSDLKEPIQFLVKEMKEFMPEKHIKLKLVMDKLPVFEVDPNRIMQILRNFVNNAIKFSPENSIIEIRVKQIKDHALISVKDQGIGISTNDQKRIFEPFFQAEQTMYRKYGGTGLGLSICRGIIQSQKGNMWIESVLNKGTTFFFTVPFTPVKEIKPIRVLFSSHEEIARKLKVLFNDILGPIGDSEFDSLNEQDQIFEENLFKYVDSLYEKKVIEKSLAIEFKAEISSVFANKKRGRL